MARPARYLADKVVDVLVYIIISSVIASIPYWVLPTLAPGLVFLTVAFAAAIGMVAVYLLAPYVERLVAKRRNAIGLDERFMPNLMALARAQYKYVLGLNIRLIGQDLDRKLSPRITTWDDVDPEFKKSLINDKSQYDALEDFSKSLRQRGDNLNKPNFDVYDNLCKANYERLKTLGLVKGNGEPPSDREKEDFRSGVAAETYSILKKFTDPLNHLNIDHLIWSGKADQSRVAILGKEDYLVLRSLYDAIEERNRYFASRRGMSVTEVDPLNRACIEAFSRAYSEVTWLKIVSDTDSLLTKARKGVGLP